MRAEIPIPREAGAVASTRHAVAFKLDSWHAPIDLPVVELLVTELVTNAVRHGDEPIRVEVEWDGEAVWVTVEDGCATMPALLDPPPDADGGRGLYLVDRMADEWGVARVGTGKQIWFAVRP
jgi:anti-sigma regulatory factor (Ser/Thr protein kinase)